MHHLWTASNEPEALVSPDSTATTLTMVLLQSAAKSLSIQVSSISS